MTRRCSVRALLTILVAALLVVHGAPVLADESSPRERYPNDVTPVPTPEQELGDGTDLASEASEETSTEPVDSAPAATLPPPEQSSPAIVPFEATEEATGDPAEQEESAVRPMRTPRSYDNPAARVAPEEDEQPAIPRLDDPVLRWLPEIMASAEANDVPPELIAGVMRLESNGNPNIISPDGARGLMQIMPDQLLGQGIYQDLWHDPATNIMAGGYELLERSWSYGTWEGAVGSYFGFGCDVFGTCTPVYVKIVFGWAAYYAPIIASPFSFGFAILPADWVPPPIVPFVEAAPVPPEEAPPPPTPDASPTPTPTATASATPTTDPTAPGATPSAEPTGDPSGSPTEAPTDEPTGEPTVALTEAPTDIPTEVPTEEPTAEPTEIPTEIPTEEPTEAPTEEPAEEPVDEPADAPTDDTGGETGGEGS